MSLGPEKIILILVVALIVFGPQRLPDIARQVGGAMRELRKMQDTVRGELEHVLHPDFSPGTAGHEQVSIEDTDHAALPPAAATPLTAASDMTIDTTSRRTGSGGDAITNDAGTNDAGTNDAGPTDDFTDDGFSGPRSFT
jgi:Tat protein translocase TatB subunit